MPNQLLHVASVFLHFLQRNPSPHLLSCILSSQKSCESATISYIIKIYYYINHFSFQSALSLRSRPFLHSTTMTLILCLTLFITGYTLNKWWIKLFSVMCFVAWTSHHVRDGSRRGLWFAPIGSTPVILYKLYLTITLVLPLVVMLLVNLFDLEFVRVSKLQRHLFKEAKGLLPV